MEFSHFVDLYVLEDSFYVSKVDLDLQYEVFKQDQNCPIHIIQNERLSYSVSNIGSVILDIYDAAPINHSFSLDSYEYWLNEASRRDVPEQRFAERGVYSRADLLYASHSLQKLIDVALEEAAKTKATLIPSPRSLLPFLAAFHEFDTPALNIYRAVADVHQIEIESVKRLLRPRTVYLPPLLSVLLSRCSSKDEIATRLIELRQELADFRATTAQWLYDLDATSSWQDKIAISREIQEVTNTLTKKFSKRRIGFYKELTGSVIEAAEDGSLTKMVTKPALKLLSKGITEIAPDLLQLRRFTGLIGLFDEAFAKLDHGSLLCRIFGDQLDISQKEVTEARKYREKMMSLYNISIPQPT